MVPEFAQLIFIVGLWVLNFFVLSLLNRRVDTASRKLPSRLTIFGSNYFLLLLLWTSEMLMDTLFPPSPSSYGLSIITLKSFTASFTLALLDFYFSKVERVGFDVIPGTFIWALCYSISVWLLVNVYGGSEKMRIFQLSDLATLDRLIFEYGRFIAFFVPLGFFTDLAFSPLHRFVHSSRWMYKTLHARHHSFRADLTSLVIYHAEALDDLLMAACPIVGFAATMAFFGVISSWLPASLWAGEGIISNAIWCLSTLGSFPRFCAARP